MCSCADTWWQRPAPWCWQRGAFHVALLQGWPRWQHEISGVDPLRKLTGAKETDGFRVRESPHSLHQQSWKQPSRRQPSGTSILDLPYLPSQVVALSQGLQEH